MRALPYDALSVCERQAHISIRRNGLLGLLGRNSRTREDGMTLCSGTSRDSHAEICFDDWDSCPACEIREELDGKVGALNERIKELEAEAEV